MCVCLIVLFGPFCELIKCCSLSLSLPLSMVKRRNMNYSTCWSSQGVLCSNVYSIYPLNPPLLTDLFISFTLWINRHTALFRLRYILIHYDDDDDYCYFSYTVPGRGCLSSCALHLERSGYIVKELWVSVCYLSNRVLTNVGGHGSGGFRSFPEH